MECIHGFEDPEWCSYCKKSPKGLNEIVYWTSGGDVFHNLVDCELLVGGQHMANRMGLSNRRIETGKHGSVGQRGACPWCCAYYFAVKKNENRRCFIKSSGNRDWIEVQYLAARLLVPSKQIFEFKVRTDEGMEMIVRKPNITFSKDFT
jgi:hypothetical protein